MQHWVDTRRRRRPAARLPRVGRAAGASKRRVSPSPACVSLQRRNVLGHRVHLVVEGPRKANVEEAGGVATPNGMWRCAPRKTDETLLAHLGRLPIRAIDIREITLQPDVGLGAGVIMVGDEVSGGSAENELGAMGEIAAKDDRLQSRPKTLQFQWCPFYFVEVDDGLTRAKRERIRARGIVLRSGDGRIQRKHQESSGRVAR